MGLETTPHHVRELLEEHGPLQPTTPLHTEHAFRLEYRDAPQLGRVLQIIHPAEEDEYPEVTQLALHPDQPATLVIGWSYQGPFLEAHGQPLELHLSGLPTTPQWQLRPVTSPLIDGYLLDIPTDSPLYPAAAWVAIRICQWCHHPDLIVTVNRMRSSTADGWTPDRHRDLVELSLEGDGLRVHEAAEVIAVDVCEDRVYLVYRRDGGEEQVLYLRGRPTASLSDLDAIRATWPAVVWSYWERQGRVAPELEWLVIHPDHPILVLSQALLRSLAVEATCHLL